MNKKVCKICLKEKDLNDFQKYLCRKNKKGKNLVNTKCKECNNKIKKDFNKLKKLYNKPIHKYCYCCDKYDENLILDHDHKTKKFRGWLCKSCNVGIGYLGDNLEGIMKALQYLKQSSI